MSDEKSKYLDAERYIRALEASSDPEKAYDEYRAEVRIDEHRRQLGRREATRKGICSRDALFQIKRVWNALSPVQRLAFLDWTNASSQGSPHAQPAQELNAHV